MEFLGRIADDVSPTKRCLVARREERYLCSHAIVLVWSFQNNESNECDASYVISNPSMQAVPFSIRGLCSQVVKVSKP